MENHFEKEVTGQNKQPARILPLPHPMGREYIYIYIYLRHSMYAIFVYIRVVSGVNVGI